MNPHLVATVTQWKEPGNFHEIQVFLEFRNLYRQFISNYSDIADPHINLLEGTVRGKIPGRVQLNGPERQAFQQFKDAFRVAHLLRHFVPGRQIRLELMRLPSQ